MNINLEYCDPFDGLKQNFWMKLEHCGRYLWAGEQLRDKGIGKVADLACANGYGSQILADYVPEVIGADRNLEYLTHARDENKNSKVLFHALDFDETPWSAEVISLFTDIEAIVCFETLEHLSRPKSVLKEYFHLLPKGGTLLLSIPNAKYESFNANGENRDPYHLNVFEYDEIQTMLRDSGFSINGIYGQDICNRIMNRISEWKSQTGKKLDQSGWYGDRNQIKIMSRFLGWPDEINVEFSYSFIFSCTRN